ncbi:hypothetical protein V835_01548 [Staphylococcus aureus W19276]|uniref:NUMOD4 motif-containing HNH endonuclease n=1 Tax=Staphylococcus aureus TaxID=1280 RepID=UPI00044B74D1|nr:NUMOD4 motif-containing HNH endonuclease [Staphylococcus aureus]EVY78360.1 hypothetical protein U334_02721 [Staphylococcus aureus T49833]EVZ26740.1 hypothetical protein U364_02708 [Staphylococcus aureus T16117]EXO72996.1 hypothetical protein V835_01548 [Staphylococcus aureus W19276]EXP42362.1 hypothetical protein V834_01405 [Staphylococcus aureus W19270]EXP43883.1 hypothetical protein V833_02025 [Staphylococcus aureus W19256]
MTNELEDWKDIKGYEGKYLISSLGRVYILERKIEDSKGRIRSLKGKIAKQSTSLNGYKFVGLTSNNTRKIHYIHRLVSEHFIEKEKNKEWVNHIDGDKTNNTIDNLEWCTPSENIKHAFDNRLNKHFIGTKAPLSKLDDNKVREMRNLYENKNTTQIELCNLYNVSLGTVGKVLRKETWKHV